MLTLSRRSRRVAIARGAANTSGVSLVEFYNVKQPPNLVGTARCAVRNGRMVSTSCKWRRTPQRGVPTTESENSPAL
jgi:hypothetical protein